MLQVTLRLRHDCAFAELSARHPTVVFAGWCNWQRDVLEVRAATERDRARFQADLDRLTKEGFVEVDPRPGAGQDRWVLRCAHPRRRTIDEMIADHGCLGFPPVMYRAGWEEYRFASLDPERLPALYDELRQHGDVEVMRTKPIQGSLLESGFFLTSVDLVGDLTEKQVNALRAAVAQGYYAVPRRTRFQDIADRLQVPRTTYEEHVRKAEAKVIHAVAPYLSLVAPSARRVAVPARRKP